MVHGEVSLVLPASRELVFDLVHDHSKRLEWDSLLRAAWREDGRSEEEILASESRSKPI